MHRAHAEVQRADGCCVPVDDDGDATFFFPAHWHRDGGSVRRGGDPTRSREHHEPILHAFCRCSWIRSTLQVSRWRNDHRCSQAEMPCPVVSVATVSDGDGSLSRGMPTPSSEHNHEERVFVSIVSSTKTVFQLCCLDTGAQLQDERWMSQTESGHLGDLLASSHMADFFLMSSEVRAASEDGHEHKVLWPRRRC